MTLPNGIGVGYTYDSASELTGLTYSLNSTILGNLAYSYDLAGRRMAVTGNYARTNLPLAVTTTAYNAANQLDVTGDFCTSESERESTLEERWYAHEEVQAGADRYPTAAD